MDDSITTQRVTEWAEARGDVRVVLLVGSRGERAGRPDALSDHDVLLFVRRPRRLESDERWFGEFGPILVRLDEAYEMLGARVATRLVQYRDGSRIDWSICGLGLLERISREETLPDGLARGFRVLVDKDGWVGRFPGGPEEGFRERWPRESEYGHLVKEFWWEVLYVAKYLARGELVPAQYSHECCVRLRCLVPMLEWHARAVKGPAARIGPRGRGLREAVGDGEWDRLGRTVLPWSVEGGWHALFETTDYFRAVSASVAEYLGFPASDDLAADVSALLSRMRNEPA